jgi:hypothetical protein
MRGWVGEERGGTHLTGKALPESMSGNMPLQAWSAPGSKKGGTSVPERVLDMPATLPGDARDENIGL